MKLSLVYIAQGLPDAEAISLVLLVLAQDYTKEKSLRSSLVFILYRDLDFTARKPQIRYPQHSL